MLLLDQLAISRMEKDSLSYEATYCYAGPFLNILILKNEETK